MPWVGLGQGSGVDAGLLGGGGASGGPALDQSVSGVWTTVWTFSGQARTDVSLQYEYCTSSRCTAHICTHPFHVPFLVRVFYCFIEIWPTEIEST